MTAQIKKTDWDKVLPAKLLFTVKEVAELGIIQRTRCHEMIREGKLEVIHSGKQNKNMIPRPELLRYLADNTHGRVQ